MRTIGGWKMSARLVGLRLHPPIPVDSNCYRQVHSYKVISNKVYI